MHLFSRRWSIGLILFGVVQSFALSARADVDVQSELQLAQAYNAASLKLWTAEANLARLRLEQLKKLRELEHASWLEVAQAEVTVDQHLARQELERRMATFLAQLSRHVARHSTTPRGRHAVRIIDPLSARLIGWFESEAVVPDWAETPTKIELPSDESILTERSKAEEAKRRVDRYREAEYAEDSVELRFALFQRDLTAARADLADLLHQQARSEHDVHLAMQKNHGEAATASSNVMTLSLSRATMEVMALESKCDGQIQLAELLLEKDRQYLKAIQQLHGDGHVSPDELQVAQQVVVNAEQRLEGFVRRRDRLADHVAHQSQKSLGLSWVESRPRNESQSYWQQLESLPIEHPTVLRHLIDLRRQRLSRLAARRGLTARLALAVATGERLRAVSDQDSVEQQSNDLDQRIVRARIAAADQHDVVLRREELRFAQHLAPKLQGQVGGVPEWMTLAVGRSVLGRLALCGILVHHSDQLTRPIVYLDRSIVYLDTYSVIDPVTLCLTGCDDESMCRTHHAKASGRLRSSASRIDMSWRTGSITPIRWPTTALASQYDLQRLCSYYCDLPGSYCPSPNLGTGRLFSSYAVPVSPSRHLVRHDDWLGIRTVNYALSRTGFSKYSGLNYAGIPMYEPVIQRVKQTVRYRPSFRTP